MPLLDIATPQLHVSFQNTFFQKTFSSSSSSRWRMRYNNKPNTIVIISPSQPRFVIKAVATLRISDANKQQPISPATKEIEIDSKEIEDELLSSSIVDVDEKEMLRRKRISKANKGKEPWNRGRKHSPETLQKIRERTKLAMHSPKVKMKLVNAIHKQSHATRLKIGASVRLTWHSRQAKRRMIARCHMEWLNLIAEASRKGLNGEEEELQWDSYEMIREQLDKEFKEGMEARRKPKSIGNGISSIPGKRTPKSLEQRKKISQAIAAKWADPEYRDRVYYGIAKHRGKMAENRDSTWGLKKKKKINTKPRIRPSRAKVVKRPTNNNNNNHVVRYKDPEAGYKLEMIKSIRAQRAASDPKITEAVRRANVLIAEAERAAEALEVAAAKTKSPIAEASLMETRKLIAEAVSYINSISPSVNEDDDEDDIVVNGKENIHLSSSWDFHVAAEDKGKRKRWVCGRLVDDEDEDEDEEQ